MNHALRRWVPKNLLPGLDQYVDHGVRPGRFLCAVLANDLQGAFAHADPTSAAAMKDIVLYVHNEIPMAAHGSDAAVGAWVKAGGCVGINGKTFEALRGGA